MSEIEAISIPAEKRMFDILFSSVLVVVLAPLFLIILIAMLIEFAISPTSRGSILYAETRISQGEPFIVYKFRIFKNSALKTYQKLNGLIHTKELERDPTNLTWTGRFLRQVYLDELPQLFNVLKGEMSLIGPRPTNPVNYQRSLEMGNQAKRLLKAGVTGYFQSHKGITLHKTQEQLDMEYGEFIKNNPGWKVVLRDLKIILISIKTVLRAEGL